MFFDNQPILQKLYLLTIWISRLALVNLLWIFFTLMGLIIFGLGPSTTAMAVVINRWVNGEENFKMFSLFKKIYLNYFIKTNIIFLIISLIGYVIVFNFNFTQIHDPSYFFVALTGAIGLIYILMTLMTFPLYANNAVSIIELFKTNVLFIVGYPLNSLIILIASTGLIIIQLFMPGLLFFFSGSAIMFITTLRIHKAISKTKEIQKLEVENNEELILE